MGALLASEPDSHGEPTTPEIRVLLAEDHKIVRQGLRALLAGQDDVCVIGEAEDGREAVEMALSLQPDVVVMDLGMPRCNGIDATREIRAELPSTQVLVLSMHDGEEYVRPALRAGASGYLLKGTGLLDLTRAIRALVDGQAFFSPAVSKILLREARGHDPLDASPREVLTPREIEILQLVAEGFTGPQIARRLGISPKTVEGHRGKVMKKLDIHSLAGLIKYALKQGLVEL